MALKRYLVDFTATTGGTVMICGRNKKEALKNLKKADHIGDQLDDQLHNLKPYEFEISFDERSIVVDRDEGSDPFTGWTGDDEEEEPEEEEDDE